MSQSESRCLQYRFVRLPGTSTGRVWKGAGSASVVSCFRGNYSPIESRARSLAEARLFLWVIEYYLMTALAWLLHQSLGLNGPLLEVPGWFYGYFCWSLLWTRLAQGGNPLFMNLCDDQIAKLHRYPMKHCLNRQCLYCSHLSLPLLPGRSSSRSHCETFSFTFFARQ